MTGEADLRTPMAPQRGVLPRAEDVEEGDVAGADAGEVSQLAATIALVVTTVLPASLV